MRIISTLALAAALAGTGLAAPAFAAKKDAAPAAKYTPAVAKGFNDAKKLNDGGDAAGATAKYNEIKAQVQTDDDKYIVGSLAVSIGQKSSNPALTKEGVDMMLASNKANPDQLGSLYFAQGRFAYLAKDYPTARTAMLAAQKAGSTDPDLVPVLVSSIQLSGDSLAALTALNDSIDKAQTANKPVPQEWYQRGVSIGYTAKGTPAELEQIHGLTTEITKKWVAAYPTKSNFHDALITYSSQYKIPSDVQVDVYRLLRAAGALSGDADYREYADDVYLRYPNEAKVVLEEGSSKNIVNLAAKNDASEVLGIVRAKVAADQASLPTADKSSRAAANGKAALSTADAYVGYAQYDKAIDLYKVALQKGGVDVPTVNLRMGWAMALAGDAAGAKQQFAAVTGVRKPIADFWLVHLDHPTAG